ncbi:hypothetical protein [Mesorhizobium shangrilense]|uniref:Uncharacterized protein n=1 Tax=Mesorhizobium shangrilense TaxID=460060 RepID=A0ABV2DDW7_9HYPH
MAIDIRVNYKTSECIGTAMIEAAADRRTVAVISVFHHPENATDLVDQEIHPETAYPEHDPKSGTRFSESSSNKNREIACG